MEMDAEGSTLTDHDQVKATSTVIPFREEIRVRRFWFFHHDLRAFTTSVRTHSYLSLYSAGTDQVVIVTVSHRALQIKVTVILLTIVID